jgi:hypothetical protein
MAENKPWLGLKMRQLPKPEYRLMKALVRKYNLRDDSEAFAVALRLLSTVEKYTIPGHERLTLTTGEAWILEAVQSLRSRTDEERTTDYSTE